MAIDHVRLNRWDPFQTGIAAKVSKAVMRVLALFLLAATAALPAQSPIQTTPGAPPAFAVASIKQSPPPSGGPMFLAAGPRPGGQWLAQNATFLMLVRSAYPGFSLPGQVVGVPDSIGAVRFDIDARAEGDPPRDVMTGMVRQLLADRFSLKVHTEQREVDVYALVLAREDGRLGPGLRKPVIDCQAREEARKKDAGVPPPVPPAPPKPGVRPECGMLSMMTNGVMRLSIGGSAIASVGSGIQGTVGRPVIDRTGLTGRWDIDLEFAGTGPLTTTDTPDAPASVFTAVQEQLGLKLESRKEKMDVLVIDQVQMPTPN